MASGTVEHFSNPSSRATTTCASLRGSEARNSPGCGQEAGEERCPSGEGPLFPLCPTVQRKGSHHGHHGVSHQLDVHDNHGRPSRGVDRPVAVPSQQTAGGLSPRSRLRLSIQLLREAQVIVWSTRSASGAARLAPLAERVDHTISFHRLSRKRLGPHLSLSRLKRPCAEVQSPTVASRVSARRSRQTLSRMRRPAGIALM